MAAKCLSGRVLAAIVSIGLSVPTPAAMAAEAVPAAAPLVRDVELSYGGLLVGRVLDANGAPLQNADVAVLADGRALATTRTDAEGVFAVSNLRGGVHQITTPENAQVCRLWAPGTAPPQAPKSIEVVAGQDVVRGQYGPPPANRMWRKAKVWATNPFIVGGVVAAAVAIPVALHNADDGPRS